MMFHSKTTVYEVVNDESFKDFGRLLFPIHRDINEKMTLEDISSSQVYIWYSHIEVKDTIGILNDLKERIKRNEQVFYPIYSKEEIALDPTKKDTGLFYFKGKAGKPYSIHNAGGGFMYVAAMHDSFPHALEVSKKGYNAFALIYRPHQAYEDLVRAITYIDKHNKELEVDRKHYSLWGGSAGARMAAVLGNRTSLNAYGLNHVAQASAVIMQYTGYTTVSPEDAPTYACVGTNDGIAPFIIMESRLKKLSHLKIPTKFHYYPELGHGFGLGRGTMAEGWIEQDIQFWEKQMR